MLLPLCVLAALALAGPARAQSLGDATAGAFLIARDAQNAAKHSAKSGVFVLKVLSYNIKGTPAAYFQGFSHNRYKKIGKVLAERRKSGDGPHVVLVQESFVERTKELREAAAYPHVVKGPGAGGAAYGAGLYALSLFPLAETRTVAFGGRACDSWDCYSNKGALFVRVHVPGLPFPLDLYTTHLQSGGAPDKEAARVKQVDVLAAFVAPSLTANRPSILAGDVNTKPAFPSYGLLVSKTGLSNAGADCRSVPGACLVAPGTDPSHLLENTHDQHLYTPRADGGIRIRPVHVERSFQPPLALSDHLGYEVHYEIRW